MKSIAFLINFLHYFYHGIQCDKTCNFVHGEARTSKNSKNKLTNVKCTKASDINHSVLRASKQH